MTEAGWLTSDCIRDMISFIRHSTLIDRNHGRKFRLFSCACARRAWETMAEVDRSAVATAERFADGQCTPNELAIARRSGATGQARKTLLRSARMAATDVVWPFSDDTVLPSLIRDIFGNPFRTVAFNPNWLTSDVVAVSRGMYEKQDFAAMPILADALQDAGCENAHVLEHCRGGGPHVRGCWVVDFVLGKS
jgi:hypothetical protein